jgi:molybdopterin synthase catalytic subunit
VIVRTEVLSASPRTACGHPRYDHGVLTSRTDDHWFALTSDVLSIGEAHDWAVRPECGAVVVFSGTVRDHAEEAGVRRDGVTHLVYEAYDEQVLPRFAAIVDEMRVRWSDLGRVVLWHRVGRLELGESSVVVAVSAPHRPDAFTAARFAIDAVKSAAPIWKLEEWSGGRDWGTGSNEITRPEKVSSSDVASDGVSAR